MARPRKRIKITGEVVPPGSLGTNPHNPNSALTPEQRWEGIVRDCAIIIADACKNRAEQASKPSNP